MDVDTIRSGLEAYRNGLELDRYELERGLRQESEARAIRRAYEDLFQPEVRDLLLRAVAKAEERGLPEDARSLQGLYRGLIRLHVARELSPIDGAISRHGRVVRVELRDGTVLPLKEVKLLLATTASPDTRAEIEGARAEQARILVPLLSEKIGIEQGIAQSLGQPNLAALMTEVGGIDVAGVAKLARELLDQTGDLYREVMGWSVRKRLGKSLQDANRCDIPFVLAGRFLDYEDVFTAADMIKRTKGFLQRMGIDLEAAGRLHVEVQKREPPRAYVGGIRVPDDVRLVLEIADGQRDWLTFLGALGRALFLAHIDGNRPFEQRGLADPSVELAYSALFRNLLLDREWLSQSLEFERSRDYLVLAYLERLYDLRLCCGRVLYDIALRTKGSAEGMEDLFEEQMRDAVGVRTPRELFLHDVRTGLHSVIQLRARLYEPLLSLHLQHYFDETWWKNPRCGPFLTGLWARGSRFSIEEAAQDIGYELSVKPLLKLFHRNL